MAVKQKKYIEDLLVDDEAEPSPGAEAPLPSPAPRQERARGMTLLGRESSLARIAAGNVRQVTQHLLDPARVRVWAGNARVYEHLTEENTRDLIDSIVAEGGQKVPAVVRRIESDPDHEFEVIAGTRRHFAISWLRSHSYPDLMFLAQVADLDDEAAFRLADIENRARKDISDLERARNYAAALDGHYGGSQKRMAERLKLSPSWLNKMLQVAALPDVVIAAFGSPAEVQLKPAYALVQAIKDKAAAKAILSEARRLAGEQSARRANGHAPFPSADVLRRLLDAPRADQAKTEPLRTESRFGRPILTVQSANRQGVTLRLHAGSGADMEELITAVREMIEQVQAQTGVSLR